MNKLENVTGGILLTNDQLKFIGEANTILSNNILGSFNEGSDYILKGCVITDDGSGNVDLTSGSVFIGGEFYPVEGRKIPSVTISEVELYTFSLIEIQITRGTFSEGSKVIRNGRIAYLDPSGSSNELSTAAYSSYILKDKKVDDINDDLQAHKAIGNNHNYIEKSDSATLILTSDDTATITPTYSKYVKNGSLINVQFDGTWSYSGSIINPVITTNIGADVGQTLFALIDSVGTITTAEITADNPAKITINGTITASDSVKIWGTLNT